MLWLQAQSCVVTPISVVGPFDNRDAQALLARLSCSAAAVRSTAACAICAQQRKQRGTDVAHALQEHWGFMLLRQRRDARHPHGNLSLSSSVLHSLLCLQKLLHDPSSSTVALNSLLIEG